MEQKMKEEMTCIKLYTRNELKGKFNLRLKDAVEIGFWWHSLDKKQLFNFSKNNRILNY